MKKILLYTVTAMASLTLASCDEDFDDWSSAQSYDQESAASAYGVSITAGVGSTVKMASAGETVQLVALTASSEEISSYTLNSITVNGESIDATIEDNSIVVDAAELAKLVESMYDSRAAETRSLEVITSISANLSNGDAVTVESATTSASFTDYDVPTASNGYYMLGDWQSWDLTNPTVMTLQDDGTYVATITTTSSGDNWYKFYRADSFSDSDWDIVNAGAIGCASNGDSSLHNLAVYEGDPVYDGVQTPVISGEGTFQVTFDPANLTYTIERSEGRYYLVGNMQTSTWSENLDCIFYAEGGNVYSYTTKWQGAWDLKFWDSESVGNWDTAWGTAVDGDSSTSGSLINSSANSFQAPSAEYYTLTIDMGSQTYTWTYLDNQEPTTYTSVSLIGDFNSWGGDIDLVEEVNAPHNWYVRTTIESEGGVKFRADYGWDVSWGTSSSEAIGETYYLSTGSDNITVPAGTYDFYLNDITGLFCIVAVE